MKTNLLFLNLFILSTMISYSQITVDSPLDLYSPRAYVIPVHTQSNQLHISAGYASSSDHGGIDFNLSYSLLNRFAVFVSATYNPFEFSYLGKESILRTRYHYKYDNLSSAFGIGYYKSGIKGIVNVVDAQLGFGYSSHNRYSYALYEGFFDKQREYDYSKIFLQLSATKVFEHFDLSLALRTTYANFGNFIEYEVGGNESFETQDIDSQLYFEPMIGGSYKYRGFKLNLQVGGFRKKYSETNGDVESTVTEGVIFSRAALQYSF